MPAAGGATSSAPKSPKDSLSSLYVYASLPEDSNTRLLRLLPSLDGSAPLFCTLEPVNLDHGRSFEALSYAWGEASFTEPLNIDGRVKYVTPNLRDALLHLRYRFKPRCLWVDAVCINHDNEVEKSRQIPFIFKIYRRASAVLVWLGCGAKEADDLAQIQSFCRHYDGSSDWQNLGISKFFRSLVTLPWFSRL